MHTTKRINFERKETQEENKIKNVKGNIRKVKKKY
jgi:hypothetical protein